MSRRGRLPAKLSNIWRTYSPEYVTMGRPMQRPVMHKSPEKMFAISVRLAKSFHELVNTHCRSCEGPIRFCWLYDCPEWSTLDLIPCGIFHATSSWLHHSGPYSKVGLIDQYTDSTDVFAPMQPIQPASRASVIAFLSIHRKKRLCLLQVGTNVTTQFRSSDGSFGRLQLFCWHTLLCNQLCVANCTIITNLMKLLVVDLDGNKDVNTLV